MSTEIFYGNFGTGKSTEMLKRIKEAAESGKECILFVPEQSSYETEKTVYFAVGAKNIRHVKVTGFSKLSREILNFYKAAKPCADNAEKLITMWKVIEKLKSDFISFSKDKNSAELCKQMLKTVSAFKNAGVDPDKYRKLLNESKAEFDNELLEKAEDFLNIYTEYNLILTENADDKLDDVSKAAELVNRHGYFNKDGKRYALFFDNFDTFSLVQTEFIKEAVKQCADAVFCLSCDSLTSRKREFLCVNKTANEIKDPDPDAKEVLFDRSYRQEKRSQTPVRIFSAKTAYDEAELIAAEIHRGVREENTRYRDYLILTADSNYEEIISDRLRSSEIPVFCDFPHSMTEKPLVNFVIAVLKACFLETEDILTLAEYGFLRRRCTDVKSGEERSGLISAIDAYNLRKAAEMYDIGAEDWKKGFENDPRTELAKCEELRKGITEPLTDLRIGLENAADGAEFSKIFMNWLLDEQKIMTSFTALSKADMGGEVHELIFDKEAAEESGRIWDALCETFSSMAHCLKNTKISINNYRLLLEGILSGMNLANPPQVLDCVTVGDIERTRKASPKTVIIAGFNEGTIPRSSDPESIFTDSERERLNLSDIPIYEKKLDRHSKEYYFAKRALELCENDLIITYAYQSPDGREAFPSDILSSAEYENLTIVSKESISEEFFINTLYDLRSALSLAYREDSAKAAKLKEMLLELNDGEYGKKAEEAMTLLSAKRRFSVSGDLAQKLLGGRKYSPSSLSKAVSCPFLYFGEYGLNLRENDSKDIDSSNNKGTAIHNILSSVLNNYPDIADKDSAEIRQIAEKAVLAEANNTIAADPTFRERTEAIFRTLTPRITAILEQIAAELQQGEYRPAAFEKKVSYDIFDDSLPPSEGNHITIEGTADRIDRCTKDGKEYIRIFDYKSGKAPTKFSLKNVEYGENLQTLLYLFAECSGRQGGDGSEEEREAQTVRKLPGGIGYFNTGEPVIYKAPFSSLKDDEMSIGKEWYDNHIISGAVFDGSRELMEQRKNYLDLINNKVKGAEKAARYFSEKYYSADILNSEKYDELKEYIEKDIIVKKILSLLNGNIDAEPLDISSPCKYCQLSCICSRREQFVEHIDSGDLNKYIAGKGAEESGGEAPEDNEQTAEREG